MFVGFICRFLAHFETIILGRGIGWNVSLEGTLHSALSQKAWVLVMRETKARQM